MPWTWPAIWQSERGGWWRVLLTLALYFTGAGLGIALYTVLNLKWLKSALAGQPAHVQDIPPLLGTVVITGLGLLGCLAGVRFIHRKPSTQVFTDGRPFQPGLALRSAAVWALLWLAFTLPIPGAWQGMLQRTREIPLLWWPVALVLVTAAMTVGRACEEIVFRGYLLTRLAAWLKRPWLAVLLVSFAFTAMHRGNNAALTAITLLGIAWGVACIRAGTLAPMIGAHVVHDVMNVLLVPEANDANTSTTWLEVGLIAAAICVWLAWLCHATRQTPNAPLIDPAHCPGDFIREATQDCETVATEPPVRC